MKIGCGSRARDAPLHWGVRDYLLRLAVWLGTSAVLMTEALSLFHALNAATLVIGWCAAVGATLMVLPRPQFRLRFDRVEAVICGVAAAIVGVAGFTAIVSPPNSADAMAYHLPRVVYWAQAGRVAFFPTPYFNQVMLGPMAEYLMLHTYLLTAGDHLVNLVAWAAFAGCVIGVSAIAFEAGLGRRGQAFAALLCATLPNAILQASGAKNDLMLSFWLVCAVWGSWGGRSVFVVRPPGMQTAVSGLLLGSAIGLAIATKATAYLFLAPLLVWVVVTRRRAAVYALACALLLSIPQYIRNLRLAGSPLGYDSAQGDGHFRWRNEYFGWQPLVSNALRNASDQVGARSPRWNESVFHAVVRIHHAIGLDPNDPATTWRGATYVPPVNANHEANANSRWHLLLYAVAAAVAVRHRQWRLYAAGLGAAFLLFCLYLKWQPFLARLELPLFILAAPLGAWLLDRLRPTWLALLVCVFFISGARLPLLENWTRPLRGPNSLFTKSRDENYFNDMGPWNNRGSYIESVDRVARSGCDVAGIDITENQLEYPFQALLRQRNPRVRFQHSGENACALLCLDCIGNPQKIELYRAIGPPAEIGRFLLFQSSRHP